MSDKYKKMGNILANARREQNKSLKQASESTKIMLKYLEAVETGDADNLPSKAYFTLFARSYAQYLGIDPSILEQIEAVDADAGSETDKNSLPTAKEIDDETSPAKLPSKGHGKTIAYLIFIGIVLVGSIIWYIHWSGKPEAEQTIVEQAVADPPENPYKSDSNYSTSESVYPSYVRPSKLRLAAKAKKDVTVLLLRDGDTVFNRIMRPNETGQWEANYRFILSLNNPANIDIFLNDIKLPAMASDFPRGVSELEINQVNYKKFLPPEPISDTASISRETPTGNLEKESVNGD